MVQTVSGCSECFIYWSFWIGGKWVKLANECVRIHWGSKGWIMSNIKFGKVGESNQIKNWTTQKRCRDWFLPTQWFNWTKFKSLRP